MAAVSALGLTALAGCDNTQGTSANYEMRPETTAYSENNNPQNTGAGSGTMIKPPLMSGANRGMDTPSQARVKGTDEATGALPPLMTGSNTQSTPDQFRQNATPGGMSPTSNPSQDGRAGAAIAPGGSATVGGAPAAASAAGSGSTR